MKPILAIMLVSLAFNTYSLAGTQTTYKCFENGNTEPVFSITLPQNLSSAPYKNVEVELTSGQKLNGTYNSQILSGETRLKGYTSVQFEANYSLPDYRKPHTLQANLVGNDPNGAGTFFGNASILSLTGKVIKQYLISCQSDSE